MLNGELQRHRALVELSDIRSKSIITASSLPLIERLNTYPSEGVDLTKLVTYPPRLEPIPVKPLFFDVAWNYIQYPGHAAEASHETVHVAAAAGDEEPEQMGMSQQQQKKGWFGFRR